MNIWLSALSGFTLVVALAAFVIALRNRQALRRAERHHRELQGEVEALRSTTIRKVESRLDEVDSRLPGLSDALDGLRRDVEALQAAKQGKAGPAAEAASPPREMSAQEALDLARRLYAEWCRTGRRPELPSDLEAVPMRYSRSEQKDELAKPVHLFDDAGQIAEFVRFSRKGRGDRGVVFPHPETVYRNEIRYLFEQIGESQFRDFPRPRLASTEPVTLSRRADGKWTRA